MSELMPWDKVPQPIKDMLTRQFEAEMRDNFALIEQTVIDCFLREPDIKQNYKSYCEAWFQREMHSIDTQDHYDQWLKERGIEP